MEVIIKYKDWTALPTISQLEYAIELWEGGKNFSRAGNDYYFNKCSVLSLSWDKWLDDIRWNGNSNSKTYLEAEQNHNKSEYNISINENACLVDIRALLRAVTFISEYTNGVIYWNNKWFTLDEYREENKEIISMDFSEAVNKSLTMGSM